MEKENKTLRIAYATDESTPGAVQATLIVPPSLQDGDVMQPFRFDFHDKGKTVMIFGKYESDDDSISLAIGGNAAFKYKFSASNGSKPYEWKVKSRGEVLKPVTQKDFEEDLIFAQENTIHIPYCQFNPFQSHNTMISKDECVEKWSFYGPSLPKFFYRCQIKLEVLDESSVKRQTKRKDSANLDDENESIVQSGQDEMTSEEDWW